MRVLRRLSNSLAQIRRLGPLFVDYSRAENTLATPESIRDGRHEQVNIHHRQHRAPKDRHSRARCPVADRGR